MALPPGPVGLKFWQPRVENTECDADNCSDPPIQFIDIKGDPETIKLLPERLRVLIDRSKKLNDQVRRLDANIYAPPLAPDKPRVSNPVERQMGLLKAAFGQDEH